MASILDRYGIKEVADVTVGTATTAQTLYNPIPDCGCCGK